MTSMQIKKKKKKTLDGRARMSNATTHGPRIIPRIDLRFAKAWPYNLLHASDLKRRTPRVFRTVYHHHNILCEYVGERVDADHLHE